jgi:hypothetical protein
MIGKGLRLCPALFTALILAASVAQAQTAERPVWKVGYKWTFHRVGGLPPTEFNWSREVVEVLADDRFLVRTKAGQNVVFDGETNSLDPRGPAYSGWFSFPLFVGKKWSYSRRLENTSSDGIESATWEVKAYETVTVPAGTFDCFRIEGVIWQSRTYMMYSPFKSHEDATNWFCPAVKWVARWKSRREADPSAPFIDSESVLTSFVADQ